MWTIAVADDHALIREGLLRVLHQSLEPLTLHQASSGQDALDLVRTHSVDLLILDLNLPDKHGLEVLKEVKLLKPDLPVLILSLFPEEQYALRAFKAGASGYVTKESASEEIVKAVRKVLGGGKYVSPSLGEHLVDTFQKGESPEETLSDREMEVLRLLGAGKSISEIAHQFCLSVNTISTYRTRLLDKLGLHSTGDLVRYAVTHKLVE